MKEHGEPSVPASCYTTLVGITRPKEQAFCDWAVHSSADLPISSLSHQFHALLLW